jgi:hypothetical protein
MSTTSTERLYGLFVHYEIPDGAIDNRFNLQDDAFKRRFRREMKYLARILKPNKGWRGLARVFVDVGWTRLVSLMSANHESSPKAGAAGSKIKLVDLGDQLRALSGQLASLLPKKEGVSNSIRLVTAADLIGLLTALEDCLPRDQHDKLWLYLVGERDKLLYDAPKVVEAAIRIANIGSHKPIFRFDHDVLFSACGRNTPKNASPDRAANDLTENIRRLCAHHDSLTRDPGVSYFVFSGAYCDRLQLREVKRSSTFPDASVLQNGFATRVYQLAKVDTGGKKPVLHAKAAAEFLRSLYKLGANPLRQVISGAGLCLSDGAILDLPPFCNMRQNVVWIDDHLKYALHHELFHFGYRQGMRQIASVPQAVFGQKRGDLKLEGIHETLAGYMPRLVRGCIVDSWLRADPRVKLETRRLKKEYKAIKATLGAKGSYAAFFRDAVRHGEEWDRHEAQQWQDMKRTLWNLATKRIEVLADEWSDSTYKNTYLRAYASGGKLWTDALSTLQSGGSQPAAQGRLVSLADVRKDLDGTTYPGSSGNETHRWLEMLVDDFMTYIQVTRFWRQFVFAVRALLNSPNKPTWFVWEGEP